MQNNSSNNKPILIIGGGIIGLFTAYYLLGTGKKIIIIDKSDGVDGCSMGNAGMVVPSHFIPLASPGMIEKGLKWMFDSESPFYVKPRLSLSLLKWGIDFYKAATPKKVNEAMPALRDIGLLSKKLYKDLAAERQFEFCFEEKGLMMYCKDQHVLEEEIATAELANKLGIEAKIFNKNQIDKLEPELKPNVAGGVFFTGDAHLYPNELIKNLKKHLIQNGVEIKFNAHFEAIETFGNQISKVKISCLNAKETIEVDKVILATGSWSEEIGKKLGVNIPIQAGKGYSITQNQKSGKKLNIPSIFVEARVAVTPMADSLIRFGGTMEIGGINDKINLNRVRGILKSVPKYFSDYTIEMPSLDKIWYGLRPCSPDGLPYIGYSEIYKNLIINTGHAMMGVSLASGSGLLTSELVNSKSLSMNIEQFRVDRF